LSFGPEKIELFNLLRNYQFRPRRQAGRAGTTN
jgi:hypothetical protein